MDDWAFLDEVDVIAKWPAEHKKVLFEGGKWSEKRDALEALNKIMEENPRLSSTTMTIYGELMDELRKILDRESNIVVVTFAAKTVELLAKGLRNKFGGYVGMVFPFLIKRAKDKKKNVRDAVSSSLDAVSDSTTSERILKDLVDWFAIPSPESKQTLLEFLYRYFIKMENMDISFIKTLMPMIVKCASESDVNVREKACMAIGSLKRLMGDAISPFIVSISTDNSKMEKIGQFEAQAKEEWEKLMAEKGQKKGGNVGGDGAENGEESGEKVADSGAAGASESIDPWTLMDPEDVAKKLDKTVEAQLVDKNWKERLAGCEALKKEIDAVGRIEISDRLREIIPILLKIIEKDVNVNVAACSVNCLTGIANKSRFAYSHFANKGFPVCFDKLKDKKALLRDALNELVDAAACTTPLGSYSEAVSGALASKNPQTRSQTAAFLARFFSKNDSKTMEIDALKCLVEPISKASNDADKEVREAIIRCIAAIVKSIGQNVAMKLFTEVFEDNLKSEKIPGIVEELEKEYGKIASVEMTRLAKEYKIGGSGGPAGPKKPVPTTSKPASSARPVQKAVRPVTASARTNPTPAPAPPQKVAAAAPAPKPKPFVARPAPSFANRPVNPVKITPAAVKPVVSRPATSRPATTTATSRINNSGPSIARTSRAPVAPNVVRSTPTSATLNRAPSAGRSVNNGIKPNIVSSNGSRLPPPKSSLPNSAGSSIPRPNTSSGIPKPLSLSRPGSSEVISRIRPLSRGAGSRTEINNL